MPVEIIAKLAEVLENNFDAEENEKELTEVYSEMMLYVFEGDYEGYDLDSLWGISDSLDEALKLLCPNYFDY